MRSVLAVLLFLTICTTLLIEDKACTSDEFECKNTKKCIPDEFVCDDVEDCDDGTDEVCDACAKGQFSCDSGECIPSPWICDGESDCLDSTDEQACDATCYEETELQCDHRQCIPLFWACDGIPDCFDGTDERNCSTKPKMCSFKEFRCDDETCIDKALVCDQRNDCKDGSDERNCIHERTSIVKSRTIKETQPSPELSSLENMTRWVTNLSNDIKLLTAKVTALEENQKTILRNLEEFLVHNVTALVTKKIHDKNRLHHLNEISAN